MEANGCPPLVGDYESFESGQGMYGVECRALRDGKWDWPAPVLHQVDRKNRFVATGLSILHRPL